MSPSIRMLAIAPVLFLLTVTRGASAQSAQDENAVKKMWADYVAAYNRGDAHAAAAFVADDGIAMNPDGSIVRGRAAFEKTTSEEIKSSGKGARLSIPKYSIMRFPRPDVAIVVAEGDATAPNQPPSHVKFIATLIKTSGHWLLEGSSSVVLPQK